jgi:hypothetical protein
MFKNFIKKNLKKNPTQIIIFKKKKLATQSCPHDKKNVSLGHNSITKDWNLVKINSS